MAVTENDLREEHCENETSDRDCQGLPRHHHLLDRAVTGSSVARPDNRSALRTGDLARLVGAHPNTVRVYQERGFLPPVPRTPTGYRQFTTEHLTHLRLARLLLGGPWPGRPVRASAVATLRAAAHEGLPAAAARFVEHAELVEQELARARRARRTARSWMDARKGPSPVPASPAQWISVGPTSRSPPRRGERPWCLRPAEGDCSGRLGPSCRPGPGGDLRRRPWPPARPRPGRRPPPRLPTTGPDPG
ncbi:MAG: hypothetical protein QG608_3804 [Actinomycetota bacterium]|nr:hypothetical protein [Actinomycetota bacterium]